VIVVDTSALVAIALREANADACIQVIEAEPDVLISAGTLAELLVVSARRGFSEDVSRLLDSFDFEIEPVTTASAKRVGDAYRRWGKGLHPAGLNFGDCFAYELAKMHSCPLLFVGGHFSKTDITSALEKR
jgi:ribonuclease VapC